VKAKRLPAKQAKNRRGGKRSTSWKPGQSGNPKGRRRKGETAADFVEQAMSGEEMCALAAKAARRGSITALRLLFEYRFGRPWSESELRAREEMHELEEAITRKVAGGEVGAKETREAAAAGS
jgi:hypothetical protein